MIRPSQSGVRPRLTVELLEDRSVPAAGFAAGGEVRTMLSAFDSTALNASVVTNSAYDGVATLAVTTIGGQQYRGSGSLLAESDPTYDYVLTAAHMVVDDAGNKMASVTVTWPGLATATAGPSNIFVHRGWNGNPLNGNDIAVVRIAQLTSAAPDRYELFRDRTTSRYHDDQPDLAGNVSNGVFTKVGYGLPGTGAKGYTNRSNLFGTLRAGQNRYDDTYTPTTSTNWSTHTVLAYDFDSGFQKNDTIGRYFGIANLGLLGISSAGDPFESCAAPGDSGGPSFLNGKIVGVTSAIQSFFFTDAKFGANSSFGDVGYDTRVALFADWIDAVIAGTVPPSDLYGGSDGSGGGLMVRMAVPDGWLPGPPAPAAEIRAEHTPDQSAAPGVRDAWAERVPEPALDGAHWSGPAAYLAPEEDADHDFEFLGGVQVK